MDINQLLSTSAATLLSPSKLPCLQSDTVSGLEQPVIIPLGGAAGLGNPLGIVPMPLLNQQLLVPLAAFQAAKDSVPIFPTTQLSPSLSLSHPKVIKSESLSPTLHQGAMLGTNLSIGKNKNSFPLILDPSRHQILNQPSIIQPCPLSQVQSKSLLNQNNPVQYNTYQPIADVKEKAANVTIAEEVSLKTDHKSAGSRSSNLSSSNSEIKKCVKSHNGSTSISNDDTCGEETCPETEMPHSSSNDAETKVDADSLSRIISSLPPGWKVVGLTNLTGTDGVQPTPVVDTHNAGCDNSSSRVPSPHHRCGIPDVVSVDLNIPTSCLLNDSFDSKKAENITFPINLTDISNAKAQNAVREKTCFSPSSLIHETATGSDQFVVNIKQEVVDDAITKSSFSQEHSQHKLDLDTNSTKNEWRVVGLTTSSSLLQTSVSSTGQHVSNAPLPFSLLNSSELGGSSEDRQTNSRSPKATILNVPSPKLIQQSVKTSSPQQLSTCLDVMNNCDDEMRWTIVGVTVASTMPTTSTVAGSGSRGMDSTSVASTKINNGIANDVVKADCVVTNSQQRPVSSSEAKNSPLSSESSQKGIESLLARDQWKVVGITHGANEKQMSQIPPMRYQVPVPLPKQQQPDQQLSLVTSVGSSAAATISTNLDSTNTLITSTPCLSSNELLQNSLTGPLANSMSLLAPSLLPLPSPTQCNSLQEQQQLLHLIQSQLHLQHQQQEQRQLMMNHIQSQLAIQNQIPFMNNAFKEWNLVGLLSNIPSALINAGNLPDIFNSNKEKDSLSNKPIETDSNNITSERAVTKELFVPDTDKTRTDHDCSNLEFKKSRRSRDKEIAARFTKKNTVSHLLKLKRMKVKGEEGEDGSVSQSDQEGYDDVGMKHDNGKLAFLTRADKAMRSRPLHSYAGNRKIFSKSFGIKKDVGKERISLRSGIQVPVKDSESEDERNRKDVEKDLSLQTAGNGELCSESFLSNSNNNRSAARKRKLKIPRKMIADLDYQPFDSSSDSN